MSPTPGVLCQSPSELVRCSRACPLSSPVVSAACAHRETLHVDLVRNAVLSVSVDIVE